MVICLYVHTTGGCGLPPSPAPSPSPAIRMEQCTSSEPVLALPLAESSSVTVLWPWERPTGGSGCPCGTCRMRTPEERELGLLAHDKPIKPTACLSLTHHSPLVTLMLLTLSLKQLTCEFWIKFGFCAQVSVYPTFVVIDYILFGFHV